MPAWRDVAAGMAATNRARRSAQAEALRANLDRCAVRRNPPEFLNLFVGACDETRSPILPTVKRANPTESVSNSMYHDVRTRRDPARCRTPALEVNPFLTISALTERLVENIVASLSD